MSTKTSTGFKLSVMTLAIMNVTAVVSLRGLPAEAVYWLSSAFYYLFAAIVFAVTLLISGAGLLCYRWICKRHNREHPPHKPQD